MDNFGILLFFPHLLRILDQIFKVLHVDVLMLLGVTVSVGILNWLRRWLGWGSRFVLWRRNLLSLLLVFVFVVRLILGWLLLLRLRRYSGATLRVFESLDFGFAGRVLGLLLPL